MAKKAKKQPKLLRLPDGSWLNPRLVHGIELARAALGNAASVRVYGETPYGSALSIDVPFADRRSAQAFTNWLGEFINRLRTTPADLTPEDWVWTASEVPAIETDRPLRSISLRDR